MLAFCSFKFFLVALIFVKCWKCQKTADEQFDNLINLMIKFLRTGESGENFNLWPLESEKVPGINFNEDVDHSVTVRWSCELLQSPVFTHHTASTCSASIIAAPQPQLAINCLKLYKPHQLTRQWSAAAVKPSDALLFTSQAPKKESRIYYLSFSFSFYNDIFLVSHQIFLLK